MLWFYINYVNIESDEFIKEATLHKVLKLVLVSLF